MEAHALSKLFRRQNVAATTVLFLCLLVMAFGFAASTARLREDGSSASAKNERRFKDTVPEHVPIKAKLKNEQSFKELKNKNWARELEIEVRNTGSKPIYYLYVVFVMPDVLVGGHPLSMRTTYGRKELGLPETRVEPSDVPVLMPGESLTIKLPENKVRAYERARDKAGRDDPKTVEFEVQAVKFGDGTGFRGREGKDWREGAAEHWPQQPVSELTPRGGEKRGGREQPGLESSAGAYYTVKPASILRAYLLPFEEVVASSAPSVPDDCGCRSRTGADDSCAPLVLAHAA